jgi:hypothetical protein
VEPVMTFRVSFTARFGRQGIIQRKAFELISGAAAALAQILADEEQKKAALAKRKNRLSNNSRSKT